MTLCTIATRTATLAATTGAAAVLAAGLAHAAPADNWGAMAISIDTGSTAYAVNYASASDAEWAAVSACDEWDCQAVVNFANGCGAVAQAPDLSWGWGYGATPEEAWVNAIIGAPGYDAEVIDWACTG